MNYIEQGSVSAALTYAAIREAVDQLLQQLGPMRRVLLLPPDYTRAHSFAGELTVMIYEQLRGKAHIEIMPALGTHSAMTPQQLDAMFPGVPHDLFRVHDWRNALVHLGEVPADFVYEQSEGKLNWPVQCEVNRLLLEGNWDRIISIGQLVPHEVVGIANHNKNVFVGTGGSDTINRTHFIGAAYGMERIMGRAMSPVRAVFDYMSTNFAANLPIVYLLTVRARDENGKLVTRGLFAGDDFDCYARGAQLCQQVNLDLLETPIKKAVVFLDPAEFKSTWLGNKAIYRTRMAIADDGELIVLAPGVREFGEDPGIDKLVRKYGYRGTPHTLQMVAENEDLASNLSAAAHLIHGSSEGRFRITYCPGVLSREEIESAGFSYGNLQEMLKLYNPEKMRDGVNRMPDGENVFYISNPALGLWALQSQFAPKEVAL